MTAAPEVYGKQVQCFDVRHPAGQGNSFLQFCDGRNCYRRRWKSEKGSGIEQNWGAILPFEMVELPNVVLCVVVVVEAIAMRACIQAARADKFCVATLAHGFCVILMRKLELLFGCLDASN